MKKYKTQKLTDSDIEARLKPKGLKLTHPYVNSRHVSTLECDNGHQWKAKATQVIAGYSGCPHCYYESKETPELDFLKFISNKNIKLIGVYKNMSTPTTSQCEKDSNHKWSTKPSHVKGGTGCRFCVYDDLRSSKDELNEKLKDTGIKLLGDYKGSSATSEFQCYTGHIFKNSPNHVLNGQGCSVCNTTRGFNQTKTGYVYYFNIIGTQLHKIGITNRPIKQRLGEFKNKNLFLIFCNKFDNGADAYQVEQFVLDLHKKYQYKGVPVLKSGNTELFTKDVLGSNFLN